MKPATTRDSSQQQQPLTTIVPSAEDEALKRNTDCVYFLASPLTCKKGIECEYRHSEEARMNPRDCWYWLNGNCLNPKCAFRHPPLDGLLGTGASATTSARPSLPPSQAAPSVQLPAAALTSSHNLSKQGTPCYFFQKGLCLKGDRCAFVHVSQSADNLPSQTAVPKGTAPITETQTLKKAIGGLEKCTQQKKTLQTNILKPVEVEPQFKPPAKIAPTANGRTIERTLPPTISYNCERTVAPTMSYNNERTVSPTISYNNELHRHKLAQAPPVISANSVTRSHRSRQTQPLDDHSFRNGKEPDEYLGESSPGFDVLVDDELRDSDYYQNEDEFGRATGHGGNHLNSLNEFDYGRSTDYSSLAKFDRETYNGDPRGYDRYGRVQDQFAREQRKEQRRVSSERISERPSMPERRGHPRADSPDRIDESDLRYRLSKQRRVNGSRSAVSPDRHGDFYRRDDRGRHIEDQKYRSQSRRDSRHLPSQESSISNRLQGRISLLGRSSPDRNQTDSHRDREMDRGRNWARVSPSRPPASSYRGKSQDGIKRRVQDDFATIRGPLIRRDDSDNDTSDFAAPKRLAELKAKVSESSEDRQARGKQIPSSGDWKNMKVGKFADPQELEGSFPFEGPKPLSEILKRKREEKAVFGDGMVSGYKDESNKKVKEDNHTTMGSEKQSSEHSTEMGFTTENAFGTVDDDDEEEEEGLIPAENAEPTNEGQPSAPKKRDLGTGDMTMMDKLEEDEELETFDQRDEESDFEQVDDGGDFKTEEDENADPEDEYLDEEDDFAKKIGVMFS